MHNNPYYSVNDYVCCRELIGYTSFFSSAIIKEPEISREASEFITENYQELVFAAVKMGVEPTKAEDIVHDVTISILEAEDVGEGYDMNKGTRENNIISVGQFVFGRLKLYSKNKKYKKPSEVPMQKADGKGYLMTEISSSSLTADMDTMSACQKAYNMAPAYDSLVEVESAQAFEEELKYVLSFDSAFGYNLSSFLKNIDYFKNNLDTIDVGGLLSKVREVNSDFREAFVNVIKFSSIDSQKYYEYLDRALVKA